MKKNILHILLTVFIVSLCMICMVVISCAETELLSEQTGPENNSQQSPFAVDLTESREFVLNGTEFTLHPASIVTDLNNDGKCSASDAREMLRIASQLSAYSGDIRQIDITGDGVISASDARLLLRYSAKLDSYYMSADGGVLSGFVTDRTGKTFYFSKYGALSYGLQTIDGNIYYFDKNDGMHKGLKNTNGSVYFFDNDGKGANGSRTVNGKQYLFENGKAVTGWRRDGNIFRYYNTDGTMATGRMTIDANACIFDASGKLTDGFVNYGGKTYYFKGGAMQKGWTTIGSYKYYFHPDGHMAKNETIDGIKIAGTGIAATAVDKSYFNDAAFVGDSISVALASYQASTKSLGNAQFFASTSLSAANALWSVSSRSVHPSYKGTKMLVEDCIQRSGAKKVYIMLGMNDIGGYSHEASIKNYKELIARIKAKSPGVDIFIQSVTPMTSISKRADSKLNNTQIRSYNEKLRAMCKEMGWHYLDVASVLTDSNGCLRQEYCSDKVYMGIHFTNKGCEQWVKYLLEHPQG